jgi:hypothetical protein
MIKFGSRGIIISIESVRFVWMETSLRFSSRIESDIDLDRLVFNLELDWSAAASGCMDDWKEKQSKKMCREIPMRLKCETR